MSRSFKFLFYFLLFFNCSAVSSAPANPKSGDVLVLAIGQSIAIEGTSLKIKFKAVLEDSRCPIDAICTWPGNGQIELEIFTNDGQNQTIILNTNEEPKSVIIKGIKLTLVSLHPLRSEGESISAKDYTVSLRVART